MLGQAMHGSKPVKPHEVKNHSGPFLLRHRQTLKDLGNEGGPSTELPGLKQVEGH